MKLLNRARPREVHVFPREHGVMKCFRFADLKKRLAFDPNDLSLYEVGDDERLPEPSTAEVQCPPNNSSIGMICFCVTDRCNLACDYCFVRKEVHRTKLLIDDLTIVRAFDFIPRAPKFLNLSFFGGEPSLAFRQIRFAMERAKLFLQRGTQAVRGHITTNGVALDDTMINYLGREGFGMIVSLDGPPELHNAHRRTARGGPSHEQVVKNLRRIKQLHPDMSKRITLRSTFLPGEIHMAERLQHLNELCEEGLAQGVSVEPAVLGEMDCIGAVGDFNPGELAHEFRGAEAWAVERARSAKRVIWMYLNKTLARLYKRQSQFSECGAGRGYIAVSPDGTIHACHKRCAEIGNVRWGFDEKARAPWREPRIYGRKRCPDCWARHLCGGGCRANSLQHSGDMTVPTRLNCVVSRARSLLALRVLAQLHDNPDAMKQV